MSADAEIAKRIESAKAKLLKTSKPGTWYRDHLGAPGYWTDGFADLDAAIALAQPPPPSGRTVRRVWVGIDGSDAFDYSTSYRYNRLIAHWFDSWASQGARFKQANANGEALAYCNFGTAGSSSALDLATARAKGYLAHHNGAEIPNPWGGSSMVMDVGRPGVVADYAAAIRARWGSSGWDGVFADDVNAWINLWSAGVPIDGYQTPGDYWSRAVLPLLKGLAPSFRIVPNIGDWSGYPALLDSAALACAGGMNEYFLMWANGASLAPSGIELQYASARKCIEAGRPYHAIVHRTDVQGLHYAWGAAAIMGGDAPGLFLLANQIAYGSAAPAWDAQLDVDLGPPTGPVEHASGSPVWARTFGARTVSIDTIAQTLRLS